MFVSWKIFRTYLMNDPLELVTRKLKLVTRRFELAPLNLNLGV